MQLILAVLCCNIQANAGERFDLQACRLLPVQHEGRVKPLDTVARQALFLLHGKQTLEYRGRTMSAIEWALEVLMRAKVADAVPIIRIEHPEILQLIGEIRPGHYSMQTLSPHYAGIYEAAAAALRVPAPQRDAFQKKVIALWEQIVLYLKLRNTLWIEKIENVNQELNAFEKTVGMEINKAAAELLDWFQQRYRYLVEVAHFSPLPPRANHSWQNMGEGLLSRAREGVLHPSIATIVSMISAFQDNHPTRFNEALHEHLNALQPLLPRARLEVFVNALRPFLLCTKIYLCAFLAVLLSGLAWKKHLARAACMLLLIGFFFHSSSLIARMVLEGRPPVTSLYSSALFVGWGIVALSLIIERRARNLLACTAGAVAGALALLIAHNLGSEKDTLEVVRAVLNSNFWLSTHVVTITLGYSATFLAGSMASAYILRDGSLTSEMRTHAAKTVYGTICLSALLTIAGTILGGIWADQSWGRFWGWDPKENGALLVILWDILILHARLGNKIHHRGLMAMAAFGNVLAALCWFGVNLLNVGLHSYGFYSGTLGALISFVVLQCLLVGWGLLKPIKTQDPPK